MKRLFLLARQSVQTRERAAISSVLLVGLALIIAVGAEVFSGTEPCALCLSQRLFLLCGALILIVGLLHAPQLAGYAIAATTSFVLGAGVAVRQLWLIVDPVAREDCGPGLTYLLNNDFPASRIFQALLSGTGACGDSSHLIYVVGSLAIFAILIGVQIHALISLSRDSSVV